MNVSPLFMPNLSRLYHVNFLLRSIRREKVYSVCECVRVYFNILRMKYEGQLDLNEARQTPTQV